MSLFLKIGLNLFDIPWLTCTWQDFRVQWMLIARFISCHLLVNVG